MDNGIDILRRIIKCRVENIDSFPYKLNQTFINFEDDFCFKEKGEILISIEDIEGNKFENPCIHKKDYTYTGGVKGVSIESSGTISFDIKSVVTIAETAKFPLLLKIQDIRNIQYFDQHYMEWNRRDKYDEYILIYQYYLLPDNFKKALEEDDETSLRELLGSYITQSSS